MDDITLKISRALVYLKNRNHYTEINEGDFVNTPALSGYFVNLSSIFSDKIYMIFNASREYKSDKTLKEVNGNYFIVINLKTSIEDLIKCLDANSGIIIDSFEKLIQKFNLGSDDEDKDEDKDTGSTDNYGLPYGYTKNKNGRVVVSKDEADMVRRVFTLYIKYKSMKQVTIELSAKGYTSRKGTRVEFATISGILHDERYLGKNLPQAIVPIAMFNKTQSILRRNAKKQGAVEQTFD